MGKLSEDKTLEDEVKTETFEIVPTNGKPKINYWKYSSLALSSIVIAFIGYSLISNQGGNSSSIKTNRTFLGQIGNATDTAFTNIFSTGISEKIVETVDLNKELAKPALKNQPKQDENKTTNTSIAKTPVKITVQATKTNQPPPKQSSDAETKNSHAIDTTKPTIKDYPTEVTSQTSATPSQAKYFLFSISKTGNGRGMIKDKNGAIICDEKCAEYSMGYKDGEEIKITASPFDRSRFIKWNNTCSASTECTVRINSNLNLEIEFDLIENTNISPSISPPPTVSPPTTTPDKDIMINEIFSNPKRGDIFKDFIELYNPNDKSIDLKNWALRKSTDGGSTTDSIAKIGSVGTDKTIIKAKGFFLIGLNNYSSNPTPDVLRKSGSLPDKTATIYLNNADGVTIETISYNETLPEGQSLERESTDSRIFRNEPIPNPQNSGL